MYRPACLFISKASLQRKLYNVFRLSAYSSSQTNSICLFKTLPGALPNLKPFNSKLSNLMKDGLVFEAQKLFYEMPQRNTITYNAMIRGYFQNGFSEEAIALYNQIPVRDLFSHNTMICGLMQYGDVKGAEGIFNRMEFRDVVTWNSMISGYMDNDLMDDAVTLFHRMPVKDVVSWNLVISGLVRIKEFARAEQMFRAMSTRDVVSGTIMMKGFLDGGRIVEARECFDDMPIKDIQAWNTMITGYVQTGLVEIAGVLFHKMPEKDMKSWSEMIDGFVSVRRINDAMKLFNEMPEKCERLWNLILLGLVKNGLVREAHALLEKNSFSNIVSLTNVMIGYFNNGDNEQALKVFEWMPIWDTTVWNAAIFGLGENDCSEDGIKLFIKMKEEGMYQDEATFTSFLTICSNLSSLNLGKQIHAEVIKVGIDCFIPIGNSLVTMYSRCGDMDSALLEFYSMTCHDVISWNSIICGFAHHGHAEQAIKMFEKMRLSNVTPNQITFVGVLSACSHAGLVEDGKRYFDIMQNQYFLHPTAEHYTCIIDLLGRFGLMDEAMNVFNQMGVLGLEIPASVWGALFGACRMHNNITIGEIAGKKILELEPYNSGVYMILTAMYLANGRKYEAERTRVSMKEIGMKKQPGCSWIDSNNGGQVFLAGDKTHPKFKCISCVLNLIYMEMEIESSKSDSASFPNQ